MTLDAGYTSEIDTVGESDWYRIIEQFSDANIYQTWSYDVSRFGKRAISHLVMRSAGEVVAAAQVRMVRVPVVGQGAAYIRWGPMWQRRDRPADPAHFRAAIRALRNEYVRRRGLFLRIFPALYEDQPESLQILAQEGFDPSPEEDRGRTLVVDVRAPLEDLRSKLDKKWRNCLNSAEKNKLDIVAGTDDSLFADFIEVYRDLLRRKQFKEPNDINEFRTMQRSLPDECKMRIVLCRSEGVTTGGAIFTAIGDTGVYLFGATNDQGMTNKSSYLLQWHAIQAVKKAGCHFYNLNGINPEKNPGTYHFKAGIANKQGKDVNYLGRFDCSRNAMHARLARSAERVLPLVKRLRVAIAG